MLTEAAKAVRHEDMSILWLKEGTHIAQLQFVIIQQYVFNLFHQLLAQSLAVSVSVELIAYVYTCVIM